MSREDPGATTGQMPYEPGRCECGDLETIHKPHEKTGVREACSNSACGCKLYNDARGAVNRG